MDGVVGWIRLWQEVRDELAIVLLCGLAIALGLRYLPGEIVVKKQGQDDRRDDAA